MTSGWGDPDLSTTPNARKRGRDADDTPEGSSRRRYNNPDHHRPSPRSAPRRGHQGQPSGESPDPFLLSVWRLGDSDRFDFRREIPESVHLIEQHFRHWPADVLTAFRIAAVELPHKLPHYALLISLLATPSSSNTDQQHRPIGLQIISDLSRSFQQHIDRRRWRATRLTVHLFAQLNLLQKPLVSDKSLLALLKAFVSVLAEEVTCSVARADECVRVAVEGLLRSGVWVRYGPGAEEAKVEDPVPDDKTRANPEAEVSKPEETPATIDPAVPDPEHPSTTNGQASPKSPPKPTAEEPKPDPEPEKPQDPWDEKPKEQWDAKPQDQQWDVEPVAVPVVDPAAEAARTAARAEEDAELRREVADLVSAIKAYIANRSLDRSLFNRPSAQSHYADPIEDLVNALDQPPITVLPVLDIAFEPLLQSRLIGAYPDPVDLPVVLLPPDDDEQPGGSTEPDKERVGYMGVRVYVPMFLDDTVPSRDTADGVVLRTLVHDVIDIFEVNRKECARVLLDLPRWVGKGTFKVKASEKTEAWILEHTLVDTMVSSIFGMPTPPIRPPVYYTSLIAELCRLSPTTVAPALGKAMRRLFGNLPDLLEPEGIRRFADWFAVHLSNFGFLWVWKDWVEVTEMSIDHPKRVLVARILELEIRLSYFDRIQGTVPVSYTEAGVMPAQAPVPNYTYESKDHPHHLAGSDIVQLLKRKEPVSRLTEYIEKMGERLRVEEGLGDEVAGELERSLVIQAILFVGSRSFSHFLNVLERYLELLKTLTGTTSNRLNLLKTVSTFWSLNTEFELIVIDKLLEYRLIKPVELLQHVFGFDNDDDDETKGVVVVEGKEEKRRGREMRFWDGVKLALEKVRRRVLVAGKRVDRIKREVEDQRDLVRAAGKTLDGGERKEVKNGGNCSREKELEDGIEELENERSELIDVLKALIKAFSKELSQQEDEEESVEELKEKDDQQKQPVVEGEMEIDDDEGKKDDKKDDDDEEKKKEQSTKKEYWRKWWVEGWAREFCRSFGNEIVDHYEILMTSLVEEEEKEGSPKNNVEIMKGLLEHTKDWIELVGRVH